MSVKLNCRTAKNISLPDALKSCKAILKPTEQGTTVALLYEPDRCRFATFRDANEGQLMDEFGQPIAGQALSNIFEARIFNSAAELRWLHETNGTGNAVLISEQDISSYLAEEPKPECVYEKLDELEPVEPPQRYLLWGEGTGVSPSNGWQRLTAARIGRLNVPLINVKQNERVQLVAREYMREVDEYGNVAVVEERLLRLEVAK